VLADYDARTTNEVLILISQNDDGPYVIIDGTHRATALYSNQLSGQANLPWKGLLITHAQMRRDQWYVQSVPKRIEMCNAWVQQGRLR
jgi:hypothetical protein